MSARSFDRVADCYDRTRGVPPDVTADITRAVAELLRPVAPRPRLFEVGVGTGRMAAPLATQGVRVVGVDVARRMLARLVAKGTAVVPVVANAQALPFRPSTFDGALFVHILHLVAEPALVVHGAGALVRPGGALVLGCTEFAPSPPGEAFELVIRTVAEVSRRPRHVDWNASAKAAFGTAAASLGAVPREETVARWTETSSGRAMLDALANRVFSASWDIPDDVMAALVARLTPAVAAITGDLDRPIERDVAFTLTIARLPERVQ